MIASEKSHKHLLLLFKKRFEINKRRLINNISGEKIRNSGNHIEDYGLSFFGNDF